MSRDFIDFRNIHWICMLLVTLLSAVEYKTVEGLVNTNRKICQGTNNGLSYTGAGTAEVRFREYRHRYTNCTYVEGNLEISHLNERDNYDLDFLKDIEEVTGYILIAMVHADRVPLTSLRMVRGYTKYSYEGIDYSLYLVNNYKNEQSTVGIKEVQMPALSEILSGTALFLNNAQLCYASTINWADILPLEFSNATFRYSSSKLTPKNCPPCHPNCKGNCWGAGPTMCQTLTRVICSPQCDARCQGPDMPQCCHKECAVGCTGPTLKDCLACRNFNNNGSCIDSCPPPMIYSNKDFKLIPNPNFKYAYGSLCVDQCPDYLLADGPHCVQDCGENKMQANETSKVCVKCEGACPKPCEATKPITSNNIKNLTGCTIVKGMISIIQSTFASDPVEGTVALTVNDLYALESVTQVTDYVLIESDNPDLTNLTFLRNLQYINGRNLYMLNALGIYDTKLKTLDLVNLKQISNGGIYIVKNPDLCYVNTTDFSQIINPLLQKVYREGNALEENCNKANAVCSEECSDMGCWGPRDDECLSCRNFKFGRRCIKSCQSIPQVYQSSQTECLSCHAECKNWCNDSLPNSCDSCLNVKDGPYCIAECPTMKYPDENQICQNCHNNCKKGCTGPRNFVGYGGCNSCDVVVLNDDGKEVLYCLPVTDKCPNGYYSEKITEEGPLKDSVACKKCYVECETCSQAGQSHCLTCVHYKELDSCHAEDCSKAPFKCVKQCSGNRYLKTQENETGLCVPCDNRCNGGCQGPTASDCSQCKQYTIYGDLALGEEDKKFNCTEKCPEYAQYIKPIEDADITVCMRYDPNRRNKVIIIVCSVMGSLVVLGAIIMGIFCNLSRRAKAEEETTRIAALISGVDENLVLMQPMNTTTANPDRAVLRLIKESELRHGNVLGAGAFGTVHKGFWYPENERIKIPVAIKVLTDSSSPTNNQELLDEARIMASVRHEYCLPILAFCMGKRMMLITPMLPHGNLLDYIRKNKEHIGSKVMLNWCAQIAEGMRYLEERKIVHRDLAARNVLVQRPEYVKITDFGLSKLIDYNENSILVTSGKMPIKWLALESIQHRVFTHKSDIWSYGVTVWEIFTYGSKPYEKVEARFIPELLEKGERLAQPEICTIDVYMLMIKCWVLDTDSRPSFKDLVEEFKKMARDPGRYLVIPGDELMRLPSNQDDSKDLLRSLSMPASEGDEVIVSADDYLQPRSYRHLSSDVIDEDSTEFGEEPWDMRENSGTSEKSSLFDSHPRATSPSHSAARTRPAVLPHQPSTDSSRAGSTGNGNTASLQRVQENSAAGPTGVGAQRNGPEKNSRYTSDPCRAALEHQLSGGSSEHDSTDGSAYDRARGTRFANRNLSSSNNSNSNGQLYVNDDTLPRYQMGESVRGRGRAPPEQLDYLQPKHSYNPNDTYLQMLDSPDGTEYLAVPQNGGAAVSNPEYFDDLGQGNGAPQIWSSKQAPVRPQTGSSHYAIASNQFRPVESRKDSSGSKEYYNEVPNRLQLTEKCALLQK